METKQWKPLTEDERRELIEELYEGELSDLSHLRGIKCRVEASEDLAYEGDVTL